ncbi:MAG: caspase family protein [Spirochaetaceae bacterium]|jgi:WD40 repeat protein|nr:caspase family protein [Spirochaetaceae bacterium]
MRHIFVVLIFLASLATVQGEESLVSIYPQTVQHTKNKTANFSSDGTYFVTGAFTVEGREIVRVWDFLNSAVAEDSKQYTYTRNYGRFKFDESLYSVFSPDDKDMASVWKGGIDILDYIPYEALVVFDTATGDILYDEEAAKESAHVTALRYSNDSFFLAYIVHTGAAVKTETDYDFDSRKEITTVETVDEKYEVKILIPRRKIQNKFYKTYTFENTDPQPLSLAFNVDDDVLAVGTSKGITLINFDSDDSRVEIPSSPVYDLEYTKDGEQLIAADGGNLKVWDTWKNRLIRTLNGRQNGQALSLALTHDDKYAVACFSDRCIKKWNIATGDVLFEMTDIPAQYTSVDISNDDRYILVGRDDGVVSCLDIESGKELVQYLSFGDEWIAITPDGYYNASPRGDEYLNIRFRTDVYSIQQFSASFYQPEVVHARILKQPDPPVVAQYGSIMHTLAPPAVNAKIINYNKTTGMAELSVESNSIGGSDYLPIESIEVTINGRQLESRTFDANTKKVSFKMPVTLDRGNNLIEVVSSNKMNYGLDIVRMNNSAAGNSVKPNLWLLAIGINEYSNFPNALAGEDLQDLNGCVSDAHKIQDAFLLQKGKQYQNVNTLLITDDSSIKPTRKNILDNLSFFKRAGSNDVIVLSIASHGITTEEGKFYFLPRDMDIAADGSLDFTRAIDIETILEAVNVPGRKIILLDACHSGAIDNNKVIRTLKNRSNVIFTAAGQNETAKEALPDDGYTGGHFTHYFVQGLNGGAANNLSSVTINNLGQYVKKGVAEQVQGHPRAVKRREGPQNPQIIIPDGYRNFVVSRK